MAAAGPSLWNAAGSVPLGVGLNCHHSALVGGRRDYSSSCLLFKPCSYPIPSFSFLCHLIWILNNSRQVCKRRSGSSCRTRSVLVMSELSGACWLYRHQACLLDFSEEPGLPPASVRSPVWVWVCLSRLCLHMSVSIVTRVPAQSNRKAVCLVAYVSRVVAVVFVTREGLDTPLASPLLSPLLHIPPAPGWHLQVNFLGCRDDSVLPLPHTWALSYVPPALMR